MNSVPPSDWIETHPDGITLSLHIVPRASATAVAGLHGQSLKLRVQAPPADGKANKALTAFLAGRLKCPGRAIAITSGAGSREKKVRIQGVSAETARQTLLPSDQALKDLG